MKLQRFAAEAWVLNVARMKELTEEKRFALAAALLFRRLARAYDDAADNADSASPENASQGQGADETPTGEPSQHSAELVSTLRNVTIAYQQDGTAEQRLQSIGAFLGSIPLACWSAAKNMRPSERDLSAAAKSANICGQFVDTFCPNPICTILDETNRSKK